LLAMLLGREDVVQSTASAAQIGLESSPTIGLHSCLLTCLVVLQQPLWQALYTYDVCGCTQVYTHAPYI